MKRKNKFSDWREDLIEINGIPEKEAMNDVESEKEISEKKVKNKIVINPEMKEAFEKIGGQVLEVVETEVDEYLETVSKVKRAENVVDKERWAVDEETEDSLRDKRQMYGGVDGNYRYDKSPVGNKNSEYGKKKRAPGPSAFDVVKSQIHSKYGKGAIIDTKKK